MPDIRIPQLRAILTVAGDYKPGDWPPPDGYLEFSEWAEVQWKARRRLKTKPCVECGRNVPLPHLSAQERVWTAQTSRGEPVELRYLVCKDESECRKFMAKSRAANGDAKP